MMRRTSALLLSSVVALMASGCKPSPSESSVDPPHTEQDGHDHGATDDLAHPQQGPHGGHLIELGEEQYHAELLHDEATHTVTVHLLDSTGTKPIATGPDKILLQVFRDAQFLEFELSAAGDSTEPAGSHFQLIDEDLVDFLLHAESVRARLQATIDGQEYIGTIEHTAHDHDAHAGHDDDEDHGEEDHTES